MRHWLAALALAATLVPGAQAQVETAEQVHAAERARFGFGPLRPGASGDAARANAANSDEAKAGNVALPPLFASSAIPTPEQWAQRRTELVRLIAAKMKHGVIGLARWPREKTDWGALRAWAWGASRLREELALDPRIDGERISLQGHSRFGKGVLVAAAFDHAFADANVSSSGAGGAKLMRRDFGERWENMAGSGAFHWFTPNVMAFAGRGMAAAHLPIDARTLIALRAPRPLFVTSGVADKGDAWVDPTGMWMAVRAAQPAWALFGLPVPADPAMPEPGTEFDTRYRLGWFQHTEGHIPWPGYAEFYEHEARFAGPRTSLLPYKDPVRQHRRRRLALLDPSRATTSDRS